MSTGWTRFIFTWIIIASQVIAPARAMAGDNDGAPIISPETAMRVQSEAASRRWTIENVANGSADLRAKTMAALRAGGRAAGVAAAVTATFVGGLANETVWYDIFQGMIIMGAAAVAELVKMRMTQDGILNGYELTPQDLGITEEQVGDYALQAVDDLLCSSEAGQASLAEEVGCGGEFWVGAAGGAIVRLAVEPVVQTALIVMNFVMKNRPLRMALFRIIANYAKSALMLYGFQMSGFIWSQATYVLNDPDKEARAHNLMGRTLDHWVRGRFNSQVWSDFQQSPDGQLSNEIFENMWNIIFVNPSMRQAWSYNAWRFGLARGETIIDLNILAAGMRAGARLGAIASAAIRPLGGILAAGTAGALLMYAGISTVVGLGPLLVAGAAVIGAIVTAAAVSFLVATLFGVVVSFAMVFVGGLGLGDWVTRKIQDLREWYRANRHERASVLVDDMIRFAYDVDRYAADPTGVAAIRDHYTNQLYRTAPDGTVEGRLHDLSRERVLWTNVVIEKYHELKLQLEAAYQNLRVAQIVIENSEFASNLAVVEGNEIQMYEDMRAQYCQPVNGSQPADCNMPMEEQLRTAAEVRLQIQEGDALLEEMAQDILEMYREDSELLLGITNAGGLDIPGPVRTAICTQLNTVQVMGDLFLWNFGSFHPSVLAARGVGFASPQQQEGMQTLAREFIVKTYSRSLNETEQLQKVQADLADAGHTLPTCGASNAALLAGTERMVFNLSEARSNHCPTQVTVHWTPTGIDISDFFDFERRNEGWTEWASGFWGSSRSGTSFGPNGASHTVESRGWFYHFDGHTGRNAHQASFSEDRSTLRLSMTRDSSTTRDCRYSRAE